MSRLTLSSCGVLALVLPRAAGAEGTDQFGSTQQLSPDTTIRVDILDYTTETISLDFDHSVTVKDPGGVTVGTYTTGTVTPTKNGSYYVDPSDYENDWDITVSGTTSGYGRVWSLAWSIDAGTFAETAALDGSFYTVVDGGGTGYDGVVEMKTDGLAGYIYLLAANDEGVAGANGRSVPVTGSITIQYPIYLLPPEDAAYNALKPKLSATDFYAGPEECDTVAYGVVDGTFEFSVDVEGTYHIVCDLNADGEYDITSDDDLHLLGDANSGTNTVDWDGTDNAGNPVDPGTYDCVVMVTVGEFHYVAADIETSYQGFRLFNVSSSLSRTGLSMYWNDAEVQAYETSTMPSGETALENPGPSGLDSGSYTAAADANGNARAWGKFTSESKGNNSYLDTYTWIYDDTSAAFSITVADPDLDTDADRLVDALEDCVYGTDYSDADSDGDGLGDGAEVLDLSTDPLDPDTDGDGVSDGTETPSPSSPRDTDGDGTIDALDTDDDGDGIPSSTEGVSDSDSDGTPDYRDTDDDGDGVLTKTEGTTDTDGDGTSDYEDTDDDGDGIPTKTEGTTDTDGDGKSDYKDTDDDGDGVLTKTEGTKDSDDDGTSDYLDTDDDGDGETTFEQFPRDDSDGDGTPDYLDIDDDGDGVTTDEEDRDASGDPDNDDTDGDGTPDFLDLDDDGDGILTTDEDTEIENGDPTDDDTDDDGTPDYLDPDSDGDGIPDEDEGSDDTDGDGDPDFVDLDSDGDSLLDEDEGTKDSDGDGASDFTDPDDDGDGVDTIDEIPAGDTDADGKDDYLDPDDDGDGIPTEDEGGGDGTDTDADGTPDFHDLDSDDDGILDETEGSTDTDGDGTGDWRDLDSDEDGLADETEGETDTDGDGDGNWRDPDSDGDTVPDADEGEVDTDGDGNSDYLDPDDDDDGIPTAEEAAWTDPDVDQDGDPNWQDTDADGDGPDDTTEGTDDTDGDGVPDYLDPDGEYAIYYKGGCDGCRTASPGGAGVVPLLLALIGLRRRGSSRRASGSR